MIAPAPTLSRPVLDRLRPQVFVRTVDWAAQHVHLPPGSEITGTFRPDLFPHMTAPLDDFDDPDVETITIQAASRLGKTVFGQVCLAKTAARHPAPCALADADEKSTRRVIKRTWDLFAGVDELADQLPPTSKRSTDRIQLTTCVIHGAWSGSPATAADYAARVVVLNEISKMSRRRSDEADFPHLMAERAKGFTGAKVIKISTPSLRDVCRVEAARLAGDNRARFVPCPFCNAFQILKTGDGVTPGGLKWKKAKDGHSTPELAEATAWYECERCGKPIEDHHRYDMLNAGIWVPAGCHLTKSGKLAGRPDREGPDRSYGPIGTLYSLLPSITWGRIAREFLRSRRKVEHRRNFTNSWEGKTWDPAPVRVHAHELAERLRGDTPLGTCPRWAVFCTAAVDVHEDGDAYIFQVVAWGPFAQGRAIDYGVIQGDEDLAALIHETYAHADRGRPLGISRCLIDSGSGFHTEKVYRFCADHPGFVPGKGVAGTFPEMVRVRDLDEVPKTGRRRHKPRKRSGFGRVASRILYEINHERTQKWIQAVLHGELPADGPDGFTLAEEAALDGRLLDQLLAEYPAEAYERGGSTIHEWIRTGDNEARDLARYNRALADLLMDHGRSWSRIERTPDGAQSRPPRPQKRLTTPDGRPFLITER